MAHSKKCPNCGTTEFEVKYYAFDLCFCPAEVGPDLDFEHSDRYRIAEQLERSYFGNGKCEHCGANVDFNTMKILDNSVVLRPYSVLLSYPELDDRGDPETFFWWTNAEDDHKAADNVRQVASEKNDGQIPPDDFFLLAVFRGHIEIE